jgi:5-methylcytosine-specific restriction protein A
MLFYAPADPEHIKRERRKAQELRNGSWWKQQLGKGVCYHCEGRFAKAELTMDHLIPIARGGKSTKSNCVVCCKKCNTEKGARTRAEMAMDEMAASHSGPASGPDSGPDSGHGAAAADGPDESGSESGSDSGSG